MIAKLLSARFTVSKKWLWTDQQMDRQTNQLTDQQMDIPYYRDAWMHLEIENDIIFLDVGRKKFLYFLLG